MSAEEAGVDSASRKRKLASTEVKREEDDDDDNDAETNDKKRGKFAIKFLEDKNKRHITFSKRKQGILKKAAELSILTGTQVLLLVASENGNVTHFATSKFESMLNGPGAPCRNCNHMQNAKDMIARCLTADDDDDEGEGDSADEDLKGDDQAASAAAGPAYTHSTSTPGVAASAPRHAGTLPPQVGAWIPSQGYHEPVPQHAASHVVQPYMYTQGNYDGFRMATGQAQWQQAPQGDVMNLLRSMPSSAGSKSQN